MLYIENKSNDGFSKRLYGFPFSAILLDRMNLSARNGWPDEEGRVYIIFTIEEIKVAVEDQKPDADIVASTYGLPEMARMLGVHRQTIYYIVANGDFELIKVGR